MSPLNQAIKLCSDNSLKEVATEGDPDYKASYTNAKSSCLMAAAVSLSD